jgi:2'-5' RNA ligase
VGAFALVEADVRAISSGQREGEQPSHEVRAFFGLPLPEPQREQLDRYLAACAAVAPEFRWTPAANLHLTIRFLGQVEPAVAEAIADAIEATAPYAFNMSLGEVGAFKRDRLARVVWLGLSEGTAEVAALAAVAEAASVAAGLEAEARRFNAHLTLARSRAREGGALPALPAAPQLPAWRAGELILYRSHLGRAGSVYEPLRRIRLRGP